ncbi:MAG: hypothetical protein WDM90_07425 [Ferruginibacter sp.]
MHYRHRLPLVHGHNIWPAATIADASNPQTVVSGLTTGSYVFRWSVSAPSGCSTTDDVNIVVSNSTDVANAGTDFISCSGGTNNIQLSAMPAPAGSTGTWAIPINRLAPIPEVFLILIAQHLSIAA